MEPEKSGAATERWLGGRHITRRNFLRIGGAGLAGAALLGVAGCGGGGDQGSNGGGGKTLNVGYNEEPQILNGYIVGGDLLATVDVTAGILESPLQIQPDLGYKPLLLNEEPKLQSEDPLIIEYKLKQGLTWSDGEPLTSADAKWTYERIMAPETQAVTRTGWEKISKFETPDEQTVKMTFSEPYAPWRDLLASSVLPKHVYEGKDFNKALNNEIVGSGPFKLKEWKKGQSLTVERNKNYWGEKPDLDSVTYRFIPDTNTLLASLQSGEVDFISPPPDIGLTDKLEGYSGVKVDSAVGAQWEHLAFNMEKVSNLKLRQAIAYGINRQQIVKEVLKGQVDPLQSILMPQQGKYYTAAWDKYDHDPEKAKQLAQEAKAEGAKMTIDYTTTSGNQLRETVQQIIQPQLKELGITVNIKNTAAQTFYGEWTPEGKFELGEWNWYTSPEPQVTTIFSANQVPPKGQNYYRYGNQQVAKWLEQSDVTANEDERAKLLKQAQNQMAEDLPAIPLYQIPFIYAYNEKLSGPKVNPTLAGAFWNLGDWTLSE